MKLNLSIILIVFSISAQAQKTGTQLIRVDTLNGVDTITFRTSELYELKRNKWLTALQVDFYQIADNSSNDSIYGQTSLNDIRYYDVELSENTLISFPDTKAAISGENGIILDAIGIPNPYWGWTAYGVAGDTCIIKTYIYTRE